MSEVMLMPFGIRFPHLQLLTAIGSTCLSDIIHMCVRIVIKKLWIKSLGRGRSDGWMGCFREARALR